MTHDDLVKIAARWLRNRMGCSVVLTELACDSRTNEIPDAIGFNSSNSYLVECKTSMSDYLADQKKIFRRIPENGMGQYRFIMCQDGVIKDIYPGWGLLWVVNNRVYPHNFKDCNITQAMGLTRFDSRMDCERSILVSGLRRANEKIKELNKSEIIPYIQKKTGRNSR